MATNDLKGRVDLNVASAVSALEAAQKAFRDLAKASTDSGTKMTASQRAATKAIIEEYKKLRTAQSDAIDSAIATERKLREVERKGVNDRANARKLTDARVTAIGDTTNAKIMESDSRINLTDARAVTEQRRQQVMLSEAESRNTSRALRDQLALRRQNFREAQAIARAEGDAYDHLSATRYALYDVSHMLTMAGLAAVALETASVGVAIAWERDFANVVRTTGVAGEEINNLKADFVDLAQTIPESWASLTQIGTLAGQLGIDPSQITNFTSIVAKFAATTDVSIEDAATAFGRLNSLLPDVNGNFKGVADAVLKVGVRSVATESQIVRIATQISALGSQANFTYDEVIGLSGALASVAVPPELSRGVVTRVFGTISRSIADGGVNLERFGKLAGMTGAEFREAWSEDAGGTFVKFMSGIQEEGGNAEAAIRALGITSVRDVPILIRLANAADSAGHAGGLLAQTFRDAASATGELDRQYGIISGTIAAKLTILSNTLQTLFDALGSAQLGPLGTLLDQITKHLRDLADFTASDWGWLVGVAAAVAAVGGAVLIFTGLASRGVASYAALITALQGIQLAGGGAAISLGTMNGMLAATGPLGTKAATAIRLVSTAMKALAAITVVLALPDVADWANKAMDGLKGWEDDLASVRERVTQKGLFDSESAIDAIKRTREEGLGFFTDFDRFMSNANFGTAMGMEIKKYDDILAQLVAAGNIELVKKEVDGLGLTNKELAGILPATSEALKVSGDAAGLAGSGYTELSAAEEEAAQAHQDLLDVFAGGDAAFISLGGTITTLQDRSKTWAEAQAEATESADDSWQQYYDGQSINLQEYLTELQTQVDAQSAWEQNMTSLASRVSDETLAELGRLGPEGAPLVAQLVNASDEELQRFDTLFAQAGTDAGTQFAVALVNTQTLITDVGYQLGSAAKTELMTRLAAGEDFDTLLAEYTTRMNSLDFDVPPPSLAKPQGAVDDFIFRNNNRTIYINLTGVPTNDPLSLFHKPFNGGYMGPSGYAGGGYTGDGGKFDPAGVVHKGEFVFTKKATAAIGVPQLYAMMQAAQSSGYAGGGLATPSNSYVPSFGTSGIFGGGGGFSTLDAASIQALTSAFIEAMQNSSINLYTTDTLLATTNNRGSTALARQGKN